MMGKAFGLEDLDPLNFICLTDRTRPERSVMANFHYCFLPWKAELTSKIRAPAIAIGASSRVVKV